MKILASGDRRDCTRRGRATGFLSRPGFAERFGLAVSAARLGAGVCAGLSGPRVLLLVIARSPEVVAEAVAETGAA